MNNYPTGVLDVDMSIISFETRESEREAGGRVLGSSGTGVVSKTYSALPIPIGGTGTLPLLLYSFWDWSLVTDTVSGCNRCMNRCCADVLSRCAMPNDLLLRHMLASRLALVGKRYLRFTHRSRITTCTF